MVWESGAGAYVYTLFSWAETEWTSTNILVATSLTTVLTLVSLNKFYYMHFWCEGNGVQSVLNCLNKKPIQICHIGDWNVFSDHCRQLYSDWVRELKMFVNAIYYEDWFKSFNMDVINLRMLNAADIILAWTTHFIVLLNQIHCQLLLQRQWHIKKDSCSDFNYCNNVHLLKWIPAFYT